MTSVNQKQMEFALSLCPDSKTVQLIYQQGFKVINELNEIQFINQKEHETLYEKMSGENQKFVDLHQQIDNQETNGHIQEIQQKLNEITICLMYNMENQQDLQIRLNNYQSIFNPAQFIILVNGQKTLDKGFTINQNYKIFQYKYIYMKHNPNDICYYINKENIHWFILQKPQTDYQLIKWIYQGIFRFFDRPYCLISDLKINMQKENISSVMEEFKLSKEYFGIQLSNEINCLSDKSLPRILGIYYNYLQFQTLDSIFHTPFFCFYDWEQIKGKVDNYVKALQDDSISMQINIVLPTLMKQKLLKCKDIRGIITKKYNLQQAFQEVSILQSSLNSCYLEAYKALKTDNNIKWLLYYLKLFSNKTSLAFHVFIFIIAPYQIFYQNTNSKVLQVLVAVIIPYLIIMFLVIFILLPQQFKITALKAKKEKVKIYFKKESSKIEPKIEGLLCGVIESNILIESENKENLLIYGKPKENKNKIYYKKLSIQVGDITSVYSHSNLELQVKNKVTFLYKYLFSAFQILTICSVLVIFIDIIMTYLILWNPVKITTFILIICFFIIYFIRYFIRIRTQDWKQVWFIVLSMIRYNLIVVQLTQMYHSLNYEKNPAQYCQRVSKLGEYLTLTIAIILTLIIIESQTYYNGYVLLGIFTYYTLVNIIENIIELISLIIEIRFKLIKPKQKVNQTSPINEGNQSFQGFL